MARFFWFLILTGTAIAAEFPISKDGIGPIMMDTLIEKAGKKTHLTAYGRNETGAIIRHAQLCVRGIKQKDGCAYMLWNTAPWPPGETIPWHLEGPAGAGLPRHTVAISSISLVTKFDLIRRVFVGTVDGETGEILKEQLSAAISNSKRFEVTETVEDSDAAIRGIAQIRGAETTLDTMGLTQPAWSGRTSQEKVKTETTFSMTMILRLALPSGEVIWAWDDTKPCLGQKIRCAVDDLVAAAMK